MMSTYLVYAAAAVLLVLFCCEGACHVPPARRFTIADSPDQVPKAVGRSLVKFGRFEFTAEQATALSFLKVRA